LDLKIALVKDIKAHPEAEKLYIMQIDLGTEQRQLVAGLRSHYKPEELNGKHIVVLTNLEPAKIRGVESNGMILAAVNADHSQVFIIAPEDDIELGSKVQ
jgi:methionyl-tRNA synthetase